MRRLWLISFCLLMTAAPVLAAAAQEALKEAVQRDLDANLKSTIDRYVEDRFGEPGEVTFDTQVSLSEEASGYAIDAVFLRIGVTPPGYDPLLKEELQRVLGKQLRRLGYRGHSGAGGPLAFLSVDVGPAAGGVRERAVGVFGKMAAASLCLLLIILLTLNIRELRTRSQERLPGDQNPVEARAALKTRIKRDDELHIAPERGSWHLGAIDIMSDSELRKTFANMQWDDALLLVRSLPSWRQGEVLSRLRVIPAVKSRFLSDF